MIVAKKNFPSGGIKFIIRTTWNVYPNTYKIFFTEEKHNQNRKETWPRAHFYIGSTADVDPCSKM